MKIFNVLWADRHSDTTATPFADLQKAVFWAKEQANDMCRHPEYLIERNVEGRLFHIDYSCETGCLWITEHEI